MGVSDLNDSINPGKTLWTKHHAVFKYMFIISHMCLLPEQGNNKYDFIEFLPA